MTRPAAPRLVPLPDELEAFETEGIYEEPEHIRALYQVAEPTAVACSLPTQPLNFKSVGAFAAEYTPLAYTIEGIVRSASLYTLTAKTGAGKTAFNVVASLAVATGRADILNREVHKGRVAYLACENPDDIRMRFKIAAFLLNINLEALDDDILILEFRAKPEAVYAALERSAKRKPFALVIVDTLAAFFDGKDINDNVQGGEFMRRLRPLTQVAGLPSVIVAAHPVKNAAEDNLLPYGGGAIINEVDGNLTLWKNSAGLISLHWQGKLRGLEFDAIPFRLEIAGCPDILDSKGREVQLPTMRPASQEAAEDREEADADTDRTLLRAMAEQPGATVRELSTVTRISKSAIDRKLKSFQAQKLAEKVLNKWTITKKGREAVG